MNEQDLHEVKMADIVEVQTFPTHGIVTLQNHFMILVTLPAAQQLMQMLGDDRLINVTVKYGDRKYGETIH